MFDDDGVGGVVIVCPGVLMCVRACARVYAPPPSVTWSVQAPINDSQHGLMASKRPSLPSREIRRNRNVPSLTIHTTEKHALSICRGLRTRATMQMLHITTVKCVAEPDKS